MPTTQNPMITESLHCEATLCHGILSLENGQTLDLARMEWTIREVGRCMAHMLDHDEFPSDTCPADLYTYAYERMQEIERLK